MPLATLQAMQIARLISFAAVLVWVATAAHAGSSTWIWRDASGNKQFSDRPPPSSVPEKDILQRPAGRPQPPAAAVAAASVPASAAVPALKASDPELEARRRKEEAAREAERKAQDEKVAQQKAENCKRAQDYQRTLDSGIRITRTNEKGEREFLDDSTRAAEVQRNRDIISSQCN